VLVEERDQNTFASGRNAGSLHGHLQFDPYCARGRQWAASFAPAHQDLEVSVRGGLLAADTDEQANSKG